MAGESKRMQWLDAMRGFTMILVVAYHVAQISFGQSERVSASLPFLVLFRMPLFFFVSGFLAYKAQWVWTPGSFCSLAWKKIKVQVLPALVFLSVCMLLKGQHSFGDDMLVALRSPYKGGYWFTWVLLLMFLIYYAADAAAQWLKDKHGILLWSLWGVSVMACLSIYMPVTFGKWWKTDFMMWTSVIQVFKYMQYFLLGNLVHRCSLLSLFDSTTATPWVTGTGRLDPNTGSTDPVPATLAKWGMSAFITIAFFSCVDYFRLHLLMGQWINLSKTLATYSLLMIVILSFRHYEVHFTKDTRLGRGLQYIGTRTLDIYLLHFILLPKLPMVGEFLDKHHPNFLLDIVLSGSVALVVIGACLLVSNILRISPIFKEYLFGKK